MAIPAESVLKQLGGTATWAEIRNHTTRRALLTAVAKGDVERIARDVYALPGALLMQKRAAEMHGVISHQSAAAYWRMAALFEPTSIHITVPRNHRPLPRKGVTLHYADREDEKVTSPLRTVLDCAITLPFSEGLAIADSACRSVLIDTDQLQLGAAQLIGPGRLRAQQVAKHADPRAANPFESGMRAIAIQAGITGFEPQLVIPGSHPQKRVDLGNSELMIVFEADSFSFHGSPEALERDCRRYDELVSLGWLVQRFTYRHVAVEQEWTRQMMLSVYAQRSGKVTRTRITPG